MKGEKTMNEYRVTNESGKYLGKVYFDNWEYVIVSVLEDNCYKTLKTVRKRYFIDDLKRLMKKGRKYIIVNIPDKEMGYRYG